MKWTLLLMLVATVSSVAAADDSTQEVETEDREAESLPAVEESITVIGIRAGDEER